MTIDEAIKNLKDILEEATEEENSVCYVTNCDGESLEMGIKALEEIEEYRKIGTLKELKELHDAVHCNAFTYGYKKGSMSMLKEVNRKIDELENSCKEEYGCEIIEMYVEVVLDLKKWIENLVN